MGRRLGHVRRRAPFPSQKDRPMTDDSNNIVLTHLRGIRDDLGDIKKRLSGLEASLATVLQHQGHLTGQVAHAQVGIDRQSARIGRIEERLGLINLAAK